LGGWVLGWGGDAEGDVVDSEVGGVAWEADAWCCWSHAGVWLRDFDGLRGLELISRLGNRKALFSMSVDKIMGARLGRYRVVNDVVE
jgi:hypothetical protein